MKYLNVFWVGGLICSIAQVLIDKTKMTPARILVLFVVVGAFVSFLGIYEPLIKFAGAGASVPITGFGHSLAQGAIKGAQENGILGAISGGIKSTSAGISASIFFGFIIAVLCKPKCK